jgi:hypothetical protein
VARLSAFVLLVLITIFVLSFAFPYGGRDDQTPWAITFSFAAVTGLATIFLVGRFSQSLALSSLFGAATGALVVVCWVYGAFLAHEIGWRGLKIEDFAADSDDTVHDHMRVVLLYFGTLATIIGFFLGYLGYLPKHPPWRDEL